MKNSLEDATVIRIRPYPKVIFFYPSVLVALIYSVLGLFGYAFEQIHLLNLIFLVVFSINVLIFSFDFSVLMTIIIATIVVLGGIILYLLDWYTPIGQAISQFRPGMNAHFYYYFCIFFIIVYILVFIRTRFNYFDIRHNELFHKTGFLADTQRINAPHLSYTREIPDLFEYLLLRSGRIKLIPRGCEPFVINNVLNIKKKDKVLGEILSKMEVVFDREG
jgi:hypothetical protein